MTVEKRVVLLVGFSDEMAAAIMELLPNFINCVSIERKYFPKKIRGKKPEIVVFDLTAKLKSDGFKIAPFVRTINRENDGNPIPVQIFVVSDSSGEEDARWMLNRQSSVKHFFLNSDTYDFGGLDVFKSIMAGFYEI